MNLEGYDHSDYQPQLLKDIAGAQICVRFALFSYTPDGIAPLVEPIREAIARGIPVCAKLKIPWRWDTRHNAKDEKKKEFDKKEAAIEMLIELGVHVEMVPKVHTKVVIIDYCIFWRGSLNTMSHSPDDTKEQMERSLDSQKALEGLIRYELDKCPQCMEIAEAAPPNDNVVTDVKSVARVIRSNRIAMKLSQDEFADITGIDRVQIGRIERGEQVPGIGNVVRLLDALI